MIGIKFVKKGMPPGFPANLKFIEILALVGLFFHYELIGLHHLRDSFSFFRRVVLRLRRGGPDLETGLII